MDERDIDSIGYWSEVKLDIVRKYAAAYSTILAAQRSPPLTHVYVDAFAGSGVHYSRAKGEYVPGSPVNALLVDPPFKEYHFVDVEQGKLEMIRDIVGVRSDVYIHRGDANKVLPEEVFPRMRYEDYRRGLCLLDPYAMHYRWEVVRAAGAMRTIELFLHFPIGAMNRNVLRHDRGSVAESQLALMDAFWGDGSWREVAYTKDEDLFRHETKVTNDVVAKAYQSRLKTIAGFKYVPEPIPMRNANGATIYYLCFAAQKPAAADIVEDVFNTYRDRGLG